MKVWPWTAKTRFCIWRERQPRFLLTVELKTLSVTGKFDLDNGAEDISDLWYENGFLYMLERNSYQISKLDVSNMRVIDRRSYGRTCNPSEGRLFEPSDYGMAEALLLTSNEIWIGLDNNSVKISDHARARYQISGTNPVILIFELPPEF